MTEASAPRPYPAAVPEPTAPPEPVKPAPTGIHLGVGGDPLMIGLPVFSTGSFALGLVLIGFYSVSITSIGVIIPIVSLGTAFYEMVATIWLIFLGQTIGASVFGTFSGFWYALAFFLLGLDHHWFAIPAGNVADAEGLFFLVWCALFLFLIPACLRLPAVYPAIVALVVVALGLACAGALTGSSTILMAAGAAVLAFAFLGYWAFVNGGMAAAGLKPWPPLGRPLVR